MSGGSPTEEFGPYLVFEELGVGGMAQVHRAQRPGSIEGFSREVALKRVLPHLAHDEDFVRSFVREARLASHLRHNNVAQTYELGKVEDIYFIAMELVTGPDLRQVLRHCVQTTGPMPVPITLNILGQICEALDYAHNLHDDTGQHLGIIHRDVSPSNIIVSDGGVVKLIDFGIAKASAAGMQTMSGMLKGKFGFPWQPEYIAGTIDARADLFAVGVIAHELLTSRPLFSGRDDIETLHKLRAMEVEPPSRRNPQVPREIDDIVMTALARDPDRRWHQASALRTVLSTVTRRLGLQAMNHQVSDWITWAFEQTGKAPDFRQAHRYDTEADDEISISLDQGTAVLEDSGPSPLATMVDQPRMTNEMASGTPSTMAAQASIPPANVDAPEYLDGPSGLTDDGERRRASGRHHAMVPVAGRMSDPAMMIDAAPTKQRPADRASNPAITPPSRVSSPGIVPPGMAPKKSTEFGVAPARATPRSIVTPSSGVTGPSSSGSITNVAAIPGPQTDRFGAQRNSGAAIRLPDLPPGATGTVPPRSGGFGRGRRRGLAPRRQRRRRAAWCCRRARTDDAGADDRRPRRDG